MPRSACPPRRVTCALVAAAFLAGCSSEPTIDPDSFAKLVSSVEQTAQQVIAAVEGGNPGDADRPLHSVAKVMSSLERYAPSVGLDASQRTTMTEGIESLMAGFGELHEPMHEAEFPKDFDFAPVKAKIEAGIAKLRSALPLGISSKVDELNALAAPAAEVKPIESASDDAPLTTSPEGADPQSIPPPTGPTGEAPTGALPAVTPAAPAVPAVPAAEPPPTSGAGPRAAPFRLVSAPGVAPRPICPTVMMFDRESLDLAPERVNRAAAELDQPGVDRDSQWVQLVPTLHGRLNADLTVAAYGVQGSRAQDWTSPDNFAEAASYIDQNGAGDGLADRYREWVAAAIGQAVRRGLHVALLPHVDPAGGPVNEWRNLWDFAPERVVGAGSYRTLLLDPIADAIERECTTDTRIDFALSGEMGRSLFTHPAEYTRIVRDYRKRFVANPKTRAVRLGIALNHGAIIGEVDATKLDRAALHEFFAECDFVGYSCYSPVSVPPTPSDFARSVARFLGELRDAGVELPATTPLVFSEIGLGGGEAPGPAGPGSTLAQIVAEPWVGRGHGGGEAWGTTERRRLRNDYFAAVCEFLANQPEGGPVVERAFIWSEGPWDPQGISGDRFRDDDIAQAIARHNAG
ncbi:MAG: hypothetical protein ACRCT8_09230 [Lacipirellulaceae bacterium]